MHQCQTHLRYKWEERRTRTKYTEKLWLCLKVAATVSCSLPASIRT